MKRFKGKRNHILLIPFLLILIITAIAIMYDKSVSEKYYILLPIVTPLFLILWTYFGTEYIISDQELIFKAGINRGSLKISSIREIHLNRSFWNKIMPNKEGNNILIKYNTYDDLLVTPRDHEEFISELLNQNNSISIIK